MASADEKKNGSDTNMGADYCILYRFATTDKTKAVENFSKLVEALANVGLATEVRMGDKHSLLVFLRVGSDEHFYAAVYRSRVRDWIHGVRAAEPQKETRASLQSEPLHVAERLRIIYQLITGPKEDGGAGIEPKHDGWQNVESIFPMHDPAFNQQWVKKWSTSYLLKPADLDSIRNHLGEQIAFYFAFTQSYFTFLIPMAAFGAASWLLLGLYSPIYAIASCLWCIVFTEYWKHQEVDLAVRWGVRGVSKIEHARKQFKPEKETRDAVTGEKVQYYPAEKRFVRQLLQVPFALAAAAILGSLIATCFGIEVFISEIYQGPLKWILVYLPTGILTTCLPILSNLLTVFATRLNDFENYETDSAYASGMTAKLFVFNFITSYLGIFLTAFVYVPFAQIIVPHLDIFSVTVRPFSEHEKQMQVPKSGFTINPDRLRKQVIYFTVTAQIVNLGLELIVPYLTKKGFAKYKQMQSQRALKQGGAPPDPSEHDTPEEKEFLQRVRSEAELPVYDVTTDLREMVLQFGYLSLFSVVWPLTSCSFLANNWLELRTDAMKICVEMQRPIPRRADTIGPWLESLTFLTWLGSITTSALVYMFSNNGVGPDGSPHSITGWALLLTIFASEQIFLSVRWMVAKAIGKLDSPGRQKERRERYLVRQKYFEESLRDLDKLPPLQSAGEEINRSSLEEDARKSSLQTTTVEDRFWARQRGWRETAKVAAGWIEHAAPDEGKKER